MNNAKIKELDKLATITAKSIHRLATSINTEIGVIHEQYHYGLITFDEQIDNLQDLIDTYKAAQTGIS